MFRRQRIRELVHLGREREGPYEVLFVLTLQSVQAGGCEHSVLATHILHAPKRAS